jgi:hypothetical protein
MAQSSKYLTIVTNTLPGDGDLIHLVKGSAVYGGFTVIAAHARAGAVGTLDLILQNYGTSGTDAGGTVAHMTDGTATVWAAAVPQSLTVSTTVANLYVAANEWLVLKKVESAANNDCAANGSITIEYVEGVVKSD